MTEPDYKNILLSLCASLTQVDHMGAAWQNVEYALRLCGVQVGAAGGAQDIEKALAQLGVSTFNGVKLSSGSGYEPYY